MTAPSAKITLSELFTHRPALVTGAVVSAIAMFVAGTQISKISEEQKTKAAIDMAMTERDLVIDSIIKATKAQPGGVCHGQSIPFTVSDTIATSNGWSINRHNYTGTANISSDGQVYPNVTRVTNKSMGGDATTKVLNVKPFPSFYGIAFNPKCGISS